MPYKIAGKFVSKAAYEAHMEAEKMTDTTETVEAPKVERNVRPLVAATRRLSKAEKALGKAQTAAEKVTDVTATLDAAKAEYAAAVADVQGLLAQN